MEGFLTFVSLLFAFALILGLAYVTTKIVASANFKKYKNKNMRLLEGMQLGPQKSLQLVRVGNKILLLALSKDNVEKIETFYPNELNVSEDDYDKNIVSFQEVFEKMTKGITNNEDEKNVTEEEQIFQSQNDDGWMPLSLKSHRK